MGTPTPYGGTPMYQIPEEERTQQFDVPKELEGLPELKPEDQQYFGKLLKEVSGLSRRCSAGSQCWSRAVLPETHTISGPAQLSARHPTLHTMNIPCCTYKAGVPRSFSSLSL